MAGKNEWTAEEAIAIELASEIAQSNSVVVVNGTTLNEAAKGLLVDLLKAKLVEA